MTSAKTLHLPPPPPPTSLSCILYVRSLKAVAIYRSVSSTRSNIYDGAFLQKYLAIKKKSSTADVQLGSKYASGIFCWCCRVVCISSIP